MYVYINNMMSEYETLLTLQKYYIFIFLDLKFKRASFQYHSCLCSFLGFFENTFFFICPPFAFLTWALSHHPHRTEPNSTLLFFACTSPPNYLHQGVPADLGPRSPWFFFFVYFHLKDGSA